MSREDLLPISLTYDERTSGINHHGRGELISVSRSASKPSISETNIASCPNVSEIGYTHCSYLENMSPTVPPATLKNALPARPSMKPCDSGQLVCFSENCRSSSKLTKYLQTRSQHMTISQAASSIHTSIEPMSGATAHGINQIKKPPNAQR